MTQDRFRGLLEDRRAALVRYCLRNAGRLLRFETAEDLAQGVQLKALQRAEGFEYRSDAEFDGWIFAVAKRHLSDRRTHWGRLKRRSGRLLRITSAFREGADRGDVVVEPSLVATGPATFADRREQIVLAIRALDQLMPRDQQLVRWYGDGLALAEQAEQLGVTYDAARVAQKRALERFRKTFLFFAG